MVKIGIFVIAALGYVHYVHQASLTLNRQLDSLKQTYTSVATQPDGSLTLLQK